MSRLPCAGLCVIDFSQVLAGPYLGRILAEFGADVIKVEAPRGDLTRQISASATSASTSPRRRAGAWRVGW
jgi:crotonobetainyl-CoA:carnitine CoA-transferase CaiB-like acyl-CoA transferase